MSLSYRPPWRKPEPEGAGKALDAYHDFWVEGFTTGSEEAAVFMDGQRLRGVTGATSTIRSGGITEITLTFIARSLNKGERPE